MKKVKKIKVGDEVKIEGYARWLTVVKIREDGTLFLVHGGTQFDSVSPNKLVKVR